MYYLVHGETLPSTEGLVYNLLVECVFHHITTYTLSNMWAKWHNIGHGLQWEGVLKFILGDESVNKDNAAIEDDSLAEYDGTTTVDF